MAITNKMPVAVTGINIKNILKKEEITLAGYSGLFFCKGFS